MWSNLPYELIKFMQFMNYEVIDDHQLILLCKKQIPAFEGAFDEIVDRYSKYVYTICYDKLNCAEDAEDATQEVFVRIFFGLQKFRMESSLKTWITRIAINVSLSMILAKKRRFWKYHVSIDGDIDIENIYTTILSENSEKFFWSHVGKILNKMFTEYRKVFILKYFKNLTTMLISLKIRTTVNAAKMKIKRAKDQFIDIFSRS